MTDVVPPGGPDRGPESVSVDRRRSATAAFVLVGMANALAEYAYGRWVWPRYPELATVPIGWWVGLYAPVLGACVVVGRRLRSFTDAVLCGLAAGLATAVGKAAFGLARVPGHLHGRAALDPFRFWTVDVLRIGFGYVVVMAAVTWLSRRRAEGGISGS